jgi:hypothetical protein
MARPKPDYHDGEGVVSGRVPNMLAGFVVLGAVAVLAGVVAAVVVGAVWPALFGPVLIVVFGASPALAHWRRRHDFAALRRARRCVATAYSPVELGMMVADSPAALQALVHDRGTAADRAGAALLIEVDEHDRMRDAWREEGFEEVEGVDTHWGHVALLVRRPRSS